MKMSVAKIQNIYEIIDTVVDKELRMLGFKVFRCVHQKRAEKWNNYGVNDHYTVSYKYEYVHLCGAYSKIFKMKNIFKIKSIH